MTDTKSKKNLKSLVGVAVSRTLPAKKLIVHLTSFAQLLLTDGGGEENLFITSSLSPIPSPVTTHSNYTVET